MLFSKTVHAASLVFFGLARADFYLGTASGLNEDGGINTPSLDSYTTYILQVGDEDICDSMTVGGDPSQPSTDPSAPWTNFCGETFSNNGWNVQLNSDDTCGSNMPGNENIPDGEFYADVIDLDAAASGSAVVVGRCVSEYGGTTDCASWGSTEAETYIHCYTDALSSPRSSSTAPHLPDPIPSYSSTPTPSSRRRIRRSF